MKYAKKMNGDELELLICYDYDANITEEDGFVEISDYEYNKIMASIMERKRKEQEGDETL